MDLRLRDLADDAAIVTDRYLDSLLAAGERRADDVPADPRLDPPIRAAARWLRRDLVRHHPSFRFEERLSAKLAVAAAAQRSGLAVGSEGTVIPLLAAGLDPAEWPGLDPAADVAGERVDRSGLTRPILIGGAMASAVLSVAGAAIMAWRMAHDSDPDRAGLA